MSARKDRRNAAGIRRGLCRAAAAAIVLTALAACAGALPQTPTETPAEIPLTASPTKKPTKTSKPTSTPKPTATITLTPTDIIVPEILSAGTFTLTTRSYEYTERNAFDLDRAVNTGGKEADIHFTEGCGSMCFVYLDTVNGATSYDIGDRPAEFATCVHHLGDFTTDGIGDWGVHNFFCILTNSGNMSLVTVADWPDLSGWERLRLNYLTWDMDSPG
jgi:hypothetical protein